MNQILGRSLTILILLCSVVFFVVAVMIAAAHTNWKDRAQTLYKENATLTRLKQELEQARLDKEKQFRTEQVARAMKISNLESEVTTLKEANATLTADKQTAVEDKENYQNRLRESENRIAKLDQDIERLNKTNADYLNKIAETKSQVVSLTNQKYNLENELQKVTDREKGLADQNASMTKTLRKHGIDPSASTADIEPRLDGQVAEVNKNLDLITVNLGLDSGLRPGHNINIFRDGKYVGEATIVTSDNNRASARLIREMMQKPVQQGDHVTTNF